MKPRLFFVFSSFCLLPAFTSCEMTPDHALEMLKEGNQRYIENRLIHPNRSEERRKEVKKDQRPFAAILACSDSRVAPEIVFDQGLGDLFTVRVAGNVLGAIELESIEYAALYLHSNLIVVMGHENCGAVKAVLDGNSYAIETIASYIQPAIDLSKKQKGNQLKNAIQDNVQNVVNELKSHPIFLKLIKEKKIDVVGAYYDFKSGQVVIL